MSLNINILIIAPKRNYLLILLNLQKKKIKKKIKDLCFLIKENYMTQNFMPVSISFFSIPTGSESDEAFLI